MRNKMWKQFVAGTLVIAMVASSISFYRKEVQAQAGEKAYVTYEAEDGIVVGDETIANTTAGAVGWLGNRGKEESNVTFSEVLAEEDGIYDLTISYATGTTRSFYVEVNGGEAVQAECPPKAEGSWGTALSNLAEKTIQVPLNSGSNTIVIYNENGDCPDLDFIQAAGRKYQAENAVVTGGQKSGGAVGWLGGAGSTSSVTLHVDASRDGDYETQIFYYTGADRDFLVSVNDGEPEKITCPNSGSWGSDSTTSVTTTLSLKAGENTVRFFNDQSDCPNLDCIRVAVEPKEAAGDNSDDTDTEQNLTYNGAVVASADGALGENAVIKGTKAEITEDEENGTKVLSLGGGSAKAGVLKLPENLYRNVTDGFTISMDVYIDSGAADYTRLFQSSCCEMGASGAPWQSPSISIDLGTGNLWRTEVFVGKDGTANSVAETMKGATASTAVSRGTWHNVSMSVSTSGYTVTVDRTKIVEQAGDFSKLFGSENYLGAYVNNYIGDSIYADASVKAKIDNVKFYNSADITDDSTLQLSYDFEHVEKVEAVETTGGETVYTDGTSLQAVTELSSPDGGVTAKIQRDEETGRFFYSVSNNGKCVIYASQLGLATTDVDFTEGAEYAAGEVREVTDTYTLMNGKHDGEITDTCKEYSFILKKDGKELTVTLRVYDEGVAYQYSMKEGAEIEREASEFVFPDNSTLWSYNQPNVTYEGTYAEIPMTTVYTASGTYTTPSLVQTENAWVLLTEAAVFDKEESFCSSYLKTRADSKNLVWTFGNKQTGNVVMSSAFETPWRVAVIGSDLNTVVNSDIITSVNSDAQDRDWSFVKPGKLAWSWWSSTGDDPIAFEPQFEYIDFAAANGWEYVCLDYGWVLWDNYKEKVKELTDYAAEKGVGIWLWYGVNNTGHAAAGAYPKYSLLDEETIRTEMEWARSIGVRGVKVDYYESDNQKTMNQMYLCAEIAAENEIMVLFHGCTNPGGENRTFPNVLSYEAVYGAEYYKWRTEPSTANIITYLFTRNAVGSADFTPTAMPVAGTDATYGFMLGTAVYIESGLIHFAENVNVYEGYEGLSLMNDMPSTWDETVVAEGYPGSFGSVARRSGEDWYLASLTTEARTTDISLDFLEEGKCYTAYIYKTNTDGTGVEVKEKQVGKGDILAEALGEDDGFAAKITASEFDAATDYRMNYSYYEAENARLTGKAGLSTNLYNSQYSSGGQLVENIGNGKDNAVIYNVEVPESGVYELNIYYVSGNDRRFLISVNGNDESRLRTGKLNSGDWVTVEKEIVCIRLEKGENTIKFYNEGVYAPNLDRISVSKAPADQAETPSDETVDAVNSHPGAAYEYDIYEAENAVIAGGATNEGYYAGWIGGNSYVLFDNIMVEKAGKYYLMIQYMAGADRNFAVSVNGGESRIVECPSSGDYFTNPAAVYLEVELKAGINTIKMSNPDGDAPNLDCIGISRRMVSDIDGSTEIGKPDNTGDNQEAEDKSQENSAHSEQNTTEKEKAEGALPTGDKNYMWYALLFAGSGSILLKQFRGCRTGRKKKIS